MKGGRELGETETKLLGQLNRKPYSTHTKNPNSFLCVSYLYVRHPNPPFRSVALIFLLFLQKISQMTMESKQVQKGCLFKFYNNKCFFDKIGKFYGKVSNSISPFSGKLHFTVIHLNHFVSIE